MPKVNKQYNKYEYNLEYQKEHYYRFNIALPKSYKEMIDEKSKAAGLSKNAWLKMLIDAEMEDVRMNDSKIETIEVIELLRNKYSARLNENIISVEFSQTPEDVFIRITRQYNTELGVKREIETINLDFIDTDDGASVEEISHGEAETRPAFPADRCIEDNARDFLDNEITLENTTPLFD